MTNMILMIITLFFAQLAFASPYWDEQKVPKDKQYQTLDNIKSININHLKIVEDEHGLDVLRLQIDWQPGEKYTLKRMIVESSGTKTFLEHSQRKPRWGSYLGILKDKSGREIYYDAIGTGKEYRALTRAISLRFPVPKQEMIFELYAENPKTGVMEQVISASIPSGTNLPKLNPQVVQVRELSLANDSPSLRINIYSEGYLQDEEALFWQHAMKAVRTLQSQNFPGVAHMSFYGVFHASNQKLEAPRNLGNPIPVYNTFLGLYYPYWNNFGRWYNGMYPTDENKLREGLATAPYDYPIILTNSGGYWGVGNYMALTAIPATNLSFTYLLLHELGHYFGLNEEYDGGGRTELEFAPDMSEPWSQNITFLVDRNYQNLKWKQFVNSSVPLPTPNSMWKSNPPVYGAYLGGYADSESTRGKSHIPGLNCIMEAQPHFCEICKNAINEVVQYSLGTT